MWIFLVAVIGLVAIAAGRHRHAHSPRDLGWVTEQWLADHRGDHGSPLQ
jgi:hypothetical protein